MPPTTPSDNELLECIAEAGLNRRTHILFDKQYLYVDRLDRVPGNPDDNTKLLNTFTLQAICSYRTTPRLAEGNVDDILADFFEDFREWPATRFDLLDPVVRTQLRKVLRQKGLYTGKMNARISLQLAAIVNNESYEPPLWPEEEFRAMTFDKDTSEYAQQQVLLGRASDDRKSFAIHPRWTPTRTTGIGPRP